MRRLLLLAPALLLVAPATAVAGSPARPARAAKLPIREITVFKDGHAFVLHSGMLPADASGSVQMDYLPTPVLGTFWPYSADREARLVSVTGGARKVATGRPAVTVAELVEANPGARATLTTNDRVVYSGVIEGVTRPETLPPLAAAPAVDQRPAYGYGYYGGFGSAAPPPPVPAPRGESAKAVTVILRTKGGTVALPLAAVRTVSFQGACRRTRAVDEWRNQLTLKLQWQGRARRRSASVGLLYLQKGVRWIPSYKVSVDGHGHAAIKMQATLVNEMADLDDVTVYLVVGVPTFYFKDSPDPISLQQAFPELSRYFRSDSQTGFAFSNAVMGQGGFGGFGGGGFGGGGRSNLGDDGTRLADAGAERDVPGGGIAQQQPEDITTADRNEDLYLFTVRHVTLKQGQSQVLPVVEMTLPYRDIYTVEVPFAPPPEVQRSQNREQEAELAKMLRTPRALHKVRLTNSGAFPLTTAPALVVSGDRVISQGLMAFTAVGAESDLTMTTAGDIQVEKGDQQAPDKPRGDPDVPSYYKRRDRAGAITVTSFAPHSLELEVVRYVPGRVDLADHDGKRAQVSDLDDGNYLRRDEYPYWWGWYGWPYWWTRYNGLTRVTWNVRLEPRQSITLGYEWHYYWE